MSARCLTSQTRSACVAVWQKYEIGQELTFFAFPPICFPPVTYEGAGRKLTEKVDKSLLA